MLDLLAWMQLIGIFGEIVVAGLGVGIGMRSKSSAGWLIGLSFLLYAVYDFIQLGRTLGTWTVGVSALLISVDYLAAVIFIVWGAWKIYRALD
jgi:hypothetical protein